MVEATEEPKQLFIVPDETNLHRTLNLAWPYGRKRRVVAAKTKGLKAL